MFLNWIISSQVYNFSTIANIATLDMIHFIMILDLRFHTYFVHDTDWRVLWPAIGLEALLREPVILVQIHPTLLDAIGCRIVLNFSLNGVECPSVAFDQGWMVSMETDSEWNKTQPPDTTFSAPCSHFITRFFSLTKLQTGERRLPINYRHHHHSVLKFTQQQALGDWTFFDNHYVTSSKGIIDRQKTYFTIAYAITWRNACELHVSITKSSSNLD